MIVPSHDIFMNYSP